MASIIERLKNRRKYPITVGSETVYARSLTLGELQIVDQLGFELGTVFAIASALINEDGSQVLPRIEVQIDPNAPAHLPQVKRWEFNEEFARRAQAELADTPIDTLREISEAIMKLGQAPTVEELAKN